MPALCVHVDVRLHSAAELIDVVLGDHLGFVAVCLLREVSTWLSVILLAGVAKATGILGDEVPAAYPVTTIHVPVVEDLRGGASISCCRKRQLETIMKAQHGDGSSLRQYAR